MNGTAHTTGQAHIIALKDRTMEFMRIPEGNLPSVFLHVVHHIQNAQSERSSERLEEHSRDAVLYESSLNMAPTTIGCGEESKIRQHGILIFRKNCSLVFRVPKLYLTGLAMCFALCSHTRIIGKPLGWRFANYC
jgi:hypothetical protein